MRLLITEFVQDGRRAVIYEDKETFEIEMYEGSQLRDLREISNHTLQYVEDCAENWVIGVIK